MRGNLFTAAYPHFLLCLVQESKDFLMRMLRQTEERGGKNSLSSMTVRPQGGKKGSSWRMTIF